MVECIEVLDKYLKNNHVKETEAKKAKQLQNKNSKQTFKIETNKEVRLPIIGKSVLSNVEEINGENSKDLRVPSNEIVVNNDCRDHASCIEDPPPLSSLEEIRNFKKASSTMSKFGNRSIDSAPQSPSSDSFLSPRFVIDDKKIKKITEKDKDYMDHLNLNSFLDSPRSVLNKKRFSSPGVKQEEHSSKAGLSVSPINKRKIINSAKESSSKRIFKSYDTRPWKLEPKETAKSPVILIAGKSPVLHTNLNRVRTKSNIGRTERSEMSVLSRRNTESRSNYQVQ